MKKVKYNYKGSLCLQIVECFRGISPVICWTYVVPSGRQPSGKVKNSYI